MKISTTIDAKADVATTWSAMIDVMDWHRWSQSITSVERLDDGPLHVGSRAKVKQPGIPMMIWEVTELRDQEVFTWATKAPGMRIVGVHRLRANPDGTSHIMLDLEQRGPLVWLVSMLTGSRNRRYLGFEAAGMKAASEA